MAKFDIIAYSGGLVRFSGYPTYNGSYLKPAYIEFRNVSSDSLIDWHVGDYCDYAGSFGRSLRYEIYELPQPTRKGSNGACGEAIVYESVKLYAQTKQLEICPFRDIVANDNHIHFSTRNTVATFEPLSSVSNGVWLNDGIVSRIQANLDDMYGTNVWKVKMYDGLLGEEIASAVQEARAFSLDGGSVLDALNNCYDLWDGIGWYFDVVNNTPTIIVGRPNKQDAGNTTMEMKYGKGNGLIQIKQSQVDADKFCTRMYAYGSDRNMNMQYYKSNPTILNAESLDIQNLMIPKGRWGQTSGKYDASKAYIEDNSKIAKYGLVPKFHYFTGSDGEEIYPTLKGMTIGDVKTWKNAVGDYSYIPSSVVYSNSDRVDKILQGPIMQDNGVYTKGGADNMAQIWNSSDTRSLASLGDTPITLMTNSGNEFVVQSDGKMILKASATISPAPTPAKVGLSIYVKINNVLVYSRTQWQDTGVHFEIESESLTILKGESVKVEVKIGAVISTYTGTCVSSASLEATSSDFPTTFKIKLRQIGFDLRSRQALGSNGLATIFINGGARDNGKSNCAGRSFAVKACKYVSSFKTFNEDDCIHCGECSSYSGCPVSAFGFDGEEMKPTFSNDCIKCGACASACPFGAIGLFDTEDYWELTCVRSYDESLGLAFPNTNYTIEAGDEFVLLDIAMPDLYIAAAEQRLYNAALARYNVLSEPQKFLAPDVDPIALLAAPAHNWLAEGIYMAIKDTDLTGGSTEYKLIDSLTIAEGEGALPKITVGLRQEKSQNFIDSVQSNQSSTPITSVSSLSTSNVQIALCGTCATAAATQIKIVSASNFAPSVGSVVRVYFSIANTASEPQMQVGNDTNRPMKAMLGGSKVWMKGWDAGVTLDFRFDGTDWVVVGNPVVSSVYDTGGDSDCYEQFANGRLHCWGVKSLAAETTSISITFGKAFSDVYYCVTASTAQGANPGADPGNVWADAKTTTGCAFHWSNSVAVELNYDVEGYV